MTFSNLSRAAAAATLLVSTASAAFSAGSTQNVAMYWGQGNNQIPLLEVCEDPSIDIVNIGFVTGFPQKVGDYPTTNFANACWGDFFIHPTDPSQNKRLLKTCPTIGPGIKACQKNGKKVLLSLGGGNPHDYYLPDEPVAKYFAEFLVGAFGPLTAEWVAKGGPRPFDDAVVDGFDLDLEADEKSVPKPELIYKNYAYLVNQLKAIKSDLLISSAPQCPVPDVRLGDAIKNAPFDFIFTQFYNTEYCSAKLGYQQINQGSTGFSFDQWVQWLKSNSKNKNVKLYLGLAAGPDGLPTQKDHYLKPDQAAALVTKWQAATAKENIFGGVMLWEATVSARNKVNCQPYHYWMKSALEGTFTSKFKPCSSSSSIQPSSTIRSSSTIASTSKASSASSTSVASPTPSSSKPASSSVYVSSSAVVSSSSAHVSSSAIVSSSVSVSSSVVVSSSAHVSSSAVVSSSSASVSSSAVVSSSAPVSSSAVPSSSAYVSSSAVISSSSVDVSSSVVVSSTPSLHPTSSVYSASSSVYETQSSSIESSSGSITFTPYPTTTPSASVGYSSSSSKSVYPHSSSELSYSSQSSSVHSSLFNTSTPCTTSTKAPSSTSGYQVYKTSSTSTPGYPVYGASSSPAPGYPVYEAPSSSVKVYDNYPPSVTSKPGDDYPSYPASSSTTKIITTTYVDSCETGVTTKTETITKTICNKCKDDDSVTSVYVCHKCGPTVVTYTITKPATPPTDVPSVPTAPAKPSSPPTYGGDKPKEPTKPSTPPTYGGDVPKKQESPYTSTTVSIVYVTPVPVVPSVKHTPVPYPSAPAKNGTSGYPTKPTGTGAVPSKATGYVPPQFTGAASHVGVGMSGVLAVVVGLLAL